MDGRGKRSFLLQSIAVESVSPFVLSFTVVLTSFNSLEMHRITHKRIWPEMCDFFHRLVQCGFEKVHFPFGDTACIFLLC